MDGPAILLMGPTGAGKTDLAVRLVERFPLEIVSVDSAMVYRGMDIGTAKPSPQVLSRAPHHLLDLLDPAERYSAGRFVEDAGQAMGRIRRSGRVPLLVGGTMLYFRALQSGLASLPAADPAVREQLDREGAELGWPALHARLAGLDPEAAAAIAPHDRQRIQRALEVLALTGATLTAQRRQDLRGATRSGDLKLVLAPGDRAALACRLEQRFAAMMELGLLEEVRRLHQRGDLNAGLPSIRAVGYRQLWEHLESGLALEECVSRAVIATRQLARRQLTWLRAEPDALWFDPFGPEVAGRIEQNVSAWLQASGGPELLR